MTLTSASPRALLQLVGETAPFGHVHADADDRVDQLIALTQRLTERLAEETRAFENRRPQDAVPGLEETQRLANL